MALFEEMGLGVADAPYAPIESVYNVHNANYVTALMRLSQNCAEDEDALYKSNQPRDEVDINIGSYDAAMRAAGAGCQAVDDIFAEKTNRAFCAVRPPGHHAELALAMGFCLFNNAFITARHAQEHHGVKRVAIIDFDVHHGNGAEMMASVYDDVFAISSHQDDLYPVGRGTTASNLDSKVLNVPLRDGDTITEVMTAYNEKIFPALDKFKPELIIIAAGFDAHKDDDISGIQLESEDYATLTALLVEAANTHCAGRIVSTLEGGYNLEALKESVRHHILALQG